MKAGWQIKTLGEVLERTETVNPLQSPESEFDYIDVSSVSNTTFQVEQTQRLKGKDAPSRARKLVKTNDVLFATIRPTLRRIAIVPPHLDKPVCSTGYFVLRPKPILGHRFMYYWLFAEEFMGQMEALQKGASYPAVTDKEVRDQSIPFPPLPEQQRIVTILDEAFDGIATAKANAEKNLQNARAIFETHLHSVFTQRGVDWEEKRLGSICDRVSVGHVGPTTEFYCGSEKGIAFLRSQNVRRGYLDWDGIQHVTKAFHQRLKKSQLRAGDLLFVRVGANRGDCCSVPEGAGDINCANIVFARPKEGNAAFLERYCDSAHGRAQLLGMTTGSAQGVINTTSVAELIVPLPPLNEQMRIVERLNEFQFETQRLESIYQRRLTALDELKKSLLAQAFSGTL